MSLDAKKIFSAEIDRSSLSPLDAAVEYTRTRWSVTAGYYLAAMLPFSAAIMNILNLVSSGFRSALPVACLLLVAATIWRWVFIAIAQRRIEREITGREPLPLRGRLVDILLLRIVANFAVTWGGIAVIPAFFGFFLSGFATPMMLEENNRIMPPLKKTIRLIFDSHKMLLKMALFLIMFFMIFFSSFIIVQEVLLAQIFTSLFDLNVSELALTLRSLSWYFSVFYFCFMVFDFYWMNASVILFFDLRSRKLGTDLRNRLNLLAEANR